MLIQQITNRGDNLHEMSKPIFWKKKIEKYFQMLSAKIFTQFAKHYSTQR